MELAKQKNISQSVIDFFVVKKEFQDERTNNKKKTVTTATYLTQLHCTPSNPIAEIRRNSCENEVDTHLLHAFLCCLLARNYFAHHTYLDKDFMQNQKEESAFMLIGILITVLKLLGD